MKRSHSLEEVAAAHLPSEWTDSARWLRRRLNRGELTGFRVGRVWRMTDDDVEFLLNKHRALPAAEAARAELDSVPPVEEMSFVDGLSQRSRSRVRRSA